MPICTSCRSTGYTTSIFVVPVPRPTRSSRRPQNVFGQHSRADPASRAACLKSLLRTRGEHSVPPLAGQHLCEQRRPPQSRSRPSRRCRTSHVATTRTGGQARGVRTLRSATSSGGRVTKWVRTAPMQVSGPSPWASHSLVGGGVVGGGGSRAGRKSSTHQSDRTVGPCGSPISSRRAWMIGRQAFSSRQAEDARREHRYPVPHGHLQASLGCMEKCVLDPGEER